MENSSLFYQREMNIEAKDWKRVVDIDHKGNTLAEKESLARKMAALIKDREKCYRRWLAASDRFGPEHSVTQIFLRRWHVLNGEELMKEVAPPETETEMVSTTSCIWGSQLEIEGTLDLADAFLTKVIGKGTGILQIWKTWSAEIVHIFSEEKLQPGASNNFFLEGGEFLFGGKLLDWTEARNQKAAVEKFGKPESRWKTL